MALFGSHLSAQHIARLRQAPFLAETVLFDPTTLCAVTEEDIEKAKNEALARAIRSSSQTLRHPTPKRPAAVTKSATKRPVTICTGLPCDPEGQEAEAGGPDPSIDGPDPEVIEINQV